MGRSRRDGDGPTTQSDDVCLVKPHQDRRETADRSESVAEQALILLHPRIAGIGSSQPGGGGDHDHDGVLEVAKRLSDPSVDFGGCCLIRLLPLRAGVVLMSGEVGLND
jgi:hypothetical protein